MSGIDSDMRGGSKGEDDTFGGVKTLSWLYLQGLCAAVVFYTLILRSVVGKLDIDIYIYILVMWRSAVVGFDSSIESSIVEHVLSMYRHCPMRNFRALWASYRLLEEQDSAVRLPIRAILQIADTSHSFLFRWASQ